MRFVIGDYKLTPYTSWRLFEQAKRKINDITWEELQMMIRSETIKEEYEDDLLARELKILPRKRYYIGNVDNKLYLFPDENGIIIEKVQTSV
uniref:Uncharacterized protein n=1 Tax=Geobacillus sp. (strain Y4.1MC1) TaxID=581103 RepID=A0A7U3YCS5_GEOS0